MYPHCLDTGFLAILMYPHCHHYIGMYPHFPGIGYLSMLMYPHCRLYIGMYPHCLDNRFLGKLMYPHCLLYTCYMEMHPHCLCIKLYPPCLGYKKSVILSGRTHYRIRVILEQFCNGPFTAVIDFPKCATYFAHVVKTRCQQQIYT